MNLPFLIISLFSLSTFTLHPNARSVLKSISRSSQNGVGGKNYFIKYHKSINSREIGAKKHGRPHLVPLNFIAHAPSHLGTFVPEKVGLLLHEYYSEVYKLHPMYTNRRDLDDGVLSKKDPLVENNDPYNDDESINRYLQKVVSGSAKSEQDAAHGKNDEADSLEAPLLDQHIKFSLDEKEKSKYVKTTTRPLNFQPFVAGKKQTNDDETEEELEL